MARKNASRAKKTKTKAKRSKSRARPKSVAVRACAACGLPERETRRLVTRSSQRPTALSICESCVLEFGRELQARVVVGKTETAAPEATTQVPAPAEICGWQKFRLEGRKLEWRAERTVVQAARPAVLVHVRRSSADRHVTLTMHPGSTPTAEDAERAGHWLLAPPAEDPELSDGPEAFGRLGVLEAWQRLEVDGQALEWSAERAYVYEATPYVQIEVREHQSPNRATTYLDWRTEPTLDHAIAAARELWSADGVPVEI